METYRQRPAGIQALVFLCGSFGRVTYTFKINKDVLANVLPNLLGFVSRHPHMGRALWSQVPPNLPADARASDWRRGSRSRQPVRRGAVFRHVMHLDFALFLRMLRAAGEHTAEELLPKIDIPCLVVAGDLDSFTPPAVSRAMAEAIPGAELAMLPGSHLLPLERRDEVREVVGEFLTRVGI